MPRNAVYTGYADVVLPVAELARKLEVYRRGIGTVRLPHRPEELSVEDANVLLKIFEHMREATGHDFTSYKHATVLRRLMRRLRLSGTEDLTSYVALLHEDAAETQNLLSDLLLTVTNFFRDPEAFAVLESDVIPKLFEGKAADETVRVWVCGCATGEEAYSVAMLLFEEAERRSHRAPPQIFASDISKRALKVARAGLYPEGIASDVSSVRLSRFFDRTAGGYRIKAAVRDRVVFAAHNLLQDPSFSKLDLISCRNLLIYLNRSVHGRIFDLFHDALEPNGYLFLGNAEAVETTGSFHDIDKRRGLYQRSGGLRGRQAPNAGVKAPPPPGVISESIVDADGSVAYVSAERMQQREPEGEGPQDLADAEGVVQMLRNELEEVRAQLRKMTVEHEAANKALTETNVEMRAVNEELGSTGEELEMAKEELQSLNEELLAVNDDLRSKIDEISAINGDLQNLMNATEIGTIFLDRHLCVKLYTPRVVDLFDIAEADLGRPLDHLNHRLGSDELPRDAAQVLRELVLVEREMQHTANHHWFLIRLRPYHTVGGKAEGVVITFVDITERKKYDEQLETLVDTLEEMVAARAEQVTQLASELSRAEQTERQRIAQILHDDLQQLLHALHIRVEVLSRSLSFEQADRLSQANSLISRAIEVTRTLTVDLSPPVLKGEEFTAALEWLAIQMEDMHCLKVEVVAPAPVRLPAELRSLLYQMVRELLFNVVKHAEIDHARVLISREEDRLVLVVSDEGSGFELGREQAPSKQGGFGLSSIRQRLDLRGGRLEMEAAPGSGTRARLIVPLAKNATGAAGASLNEDNS
jgi:two-component system CheB/CheR fusion protein